MCQKRTTTYLHCAHRWTVKERCPNYVSLPKKKCEILQYTDTVLGVCPKCSKTPQPVLAPPPFYTQDVQRELPHSGEAHRVEVGAHGTFGVRRKVTRGLRRVFGSGKRHGRSHKEEDQVASHPQATATNPNETEGSVKSSQQLAKEYKHIIGHHPRSTYGRAEKATVPTNVLKAPVRTTITDLETCTTWSTFLARPDPYAKVGVEATAKPQRESRTQPLDSLVETDQALAGTECNPRNDRSIHLDPVKKEELRKADERIARARDGRGYMHFDR